MRYFCPLCICSCFCAESSAPPFSRPRWLQLGKRVEAQGGAAALSGLRQQAAQAGHFFHQVGGEGGQLGVGVKDAL